jgi:hypothetical protein
LGEVERCETFDRHRAGVDEGSEAMSSPSRTENGERISAAQGTPDEIDSARREVEHAIIRLRGLGVDVDGMTDQPDVVDHEAERVEQDALAERAAQAQRRQDDIDHANVITGELEDARRRSGRLFGRQAAKRVVALELAQRLARDNIAPAPKPYEAPAVDGPGVVDLDELEDALADLKRADDQLERLLAPWDPKLPRRPRPWRPVTLP